MLPITDAKDKKLFILIVSYLKTGASPGIKFVKDFCLKYQIDEKEFSKYMISPAADVMLDRLDKLGMV